jgi:hypothetical protein
MAGKERAAAKVAMVARVARVARAVAVAVAVAGISRPLSTFATREGALQSNCDPAHNFGGADHRTSPQSDLVRRARMTWMIWTGRTT